ncbi:hypothetical protein F5051DRAFT_434232 [Lentinula edodes]|nr:hypothetical protein F5051DRAFT_434232 [Lentinula edodes]
MYNNFPLFHHEAISLDGGLGDNIKGVTTENVDILSRLRNIKTTATIGCLPVVALMNVYYNPLQYNTQFNDLGLSSTSAKPVCSPEQGYWLESALQHPKHREQNFNLALGALAAGKRSQLLSEN